MTYTVTIGLEVHCKLLTDSKVFCRCRNEQDFDTLPVNTHVCPVCMGMPGALPTISKEVIIKAWALGKVLGCEQQKNSHFDRKSYFYPDLPMGYQITQFAKPLNINGKILYHTIDYTEEKTAEILEAHVECDTAKTAHAGETLLLDFNRAWTPLVEIVTAPTFHSADEVHGFIREVQRTLAYYDISQAEMDKWQMRCDVNISISKDDRLGTKVEIKNMNTISGIKRAIAYETQRQQEILENGWSVDQETRMRDDAKWITILMRSKENSVDYRYFPEPDLPVLVYDKELEEMSNSLIGESIGSKIQRYRNEYGFNKEYINGILSNKSITLLFEEGIQKWFDPKQIAKYIVNYVLAQTNVGNITIAQTPFSSEEFFLFLEAISKDNISDNDAKTIITSYLATREPISRIISDTLAKKTSLPPLVDVAKEVLQEQANVVAEYKNGKTTAMWFLIGQVMKKTSWGANPQEVQKILEELL